jgi:hypothetical protein
MTTEITTIYDTLVTRVSTLLSGHKRISNPYALGQNNDQILEKGWGISVGPAVNTNRLVGGKVSVSREFGVHITRKFFARELDAVKKASTEKDLLEDLELVIDDIEQNSTLSGGNYLTKYLSDSGIVQVRDDNDSILSISLLLTVEYLRSI